MAVVERRASSLALLTPTATNLAGTTRKEAIPVRIRMVQTQIRPVKGPTAKLDAAIGELRVDNSGAGGGGTTPA